MKNLIFGSVLLVSGTTLTSSILIAASVYTVTLDGWGGDSKIKSILFGGPYVQSENLMLGFPFVVGIILMSLGLLIVSIQWHLDWNQEADKKLAKMKSEAPQKSLDL